MHKGVSQEDAYFAKMEFEKRQHQEAEKQKKLKEEEKKKLKALHHMRCPKCGMELIEVDYKTLKVDRCSACEGVWLDSGEMEALIGLEKTSLSKVFGLFKK